MTTVPAYRTPEDRVVYRLLPDRVRALAQASTRLGRVWLVAAVTGFVAGAFWLMWSVVFFATKAPLKGTLLFTFGGMIPVLAGIAAIRAARRRATLAEQLTLFADGFGGRSTIGADDAAACTPFDEAACGHALAHAVDRGAAVVVRTEELPLMPPAGLDRARLIREREEGLRRARRAGTLALLAFAFASWWAVVGATGLAEGEYLVAILVLVFTMVIPAIVAVFALLRARRERIAVARLVRLSAVVAAHDVRGFDELSEWLACTEAEGRAAALDAKSRGVLADTVLATLGGADLPTASGASLRRRRRGPVSTAGTVIGDRWVVEGVLGQGGMGVVYRVRDRESGKAFALKTMLEDDPDLRARFAREARAAALLSHPNVVRVHAVGEDGGLTYLVMDLLEGETLERRLERRGTLDWPTTLRVACDVGAALVAAHTAGLLHRDVKPANVFLVRGAAPGFERAVLLDFGLVRRMDGESGLTRDGAAVGTPLYMSPEQARGEPLDARSDLHALAAIVHECLTGTPPFFDRTAAAIYARLLAGDAAPLDAAVPPSVDQELRRALAPSRDDRHVDVASFVAALTAVGEGARAA